MASAESRTGDSNAVLTALLAYPLLRSVIDPQYQNLPAPQLEALMTREFGEGSADEYEAYLEGFFGDVGHWVSHAATDVGRGVVKAAPVVANIGGGVIRGATAGASLGLPGIIGGAVVGGVGQGFSSYGSGTLRDIGHGLNTATNIAGQFSGTGRLGATLGGAVSDVGQGKNVLSTAAGAATGLLGGAGGAGGALGALGGRSGLGSALGGLAGGRAGGLAGLAGLLGGGSGGGSGLASMLGGLAGGRAGGLGGVAGMLAGGGGGASGTAGSGLLSLLGRPEMLQALGSMGLGQLGAKSVPVGDGRTQVPASAFANLLGLFAQSVVDEQAAMSDGGESKLRYLLDDAGEWVVDPADPFARGVQLARLLDAAEDERAADAQLEIQVQQSQELQHQQDLLRAHQAFVDRLLAVRARQAEDVLENEMLDSVELAEVASWVDADESADEDAGEGDAEADAEFEEFDEYDEVLSA